MNTSDNVLLPLTLVGWLHLLLCFGAVFHFFSRAVIQPPLVFPFSLFFSVMHRMVNAGYISQVFPSTNAPLSQSVYHLKFESTPEELSSWRQPMEVMDCYFE